MRAAARRKTAANAAYTYWASRGGTLSASRLKEIPLWEKLPAATQAQWLDFVDSIFDAIKEPLT